MRFRRMLVGAMLTGAVAVVPATAAFASGPGGGSGNGSGNNGRQQVLIHCLNGQDYLPICSREERATRKGEA
jgi:hypothetical protein